MSFLSKLGKKVGKFIVPAAEVGLGIATGNPLLIAGGVGGGLATATGNKGLGNALMIGSGLAGGFMNPGYGLNFSNAGPGFLESGGGLFGSGLASTAGENAAGAASGNAAGTAASGSFLSRLGSTLASKEVLPTALLVGTSVASNLAASKQADKQYERDKEYQNDQLKKSLALEALKMFYESKMSGGGRGGSGGSEFLAAARSNQEAANTAIGAYGDSAKNISALLA